MSNYLSHNQLNIVTVGIFFFNCFFFPFFSAEKKIKFSRNVQHVYVQCGNDNGNDKDIVDEKKIVSQMETEAQNSTLKRLLPN